MKIDPLLIWNLALSGYVGYAIGKKMYLKEEYRFNRRKVKK